MNGERFYQTELRRAFLLENLPEPLTRASEHLQFFDNYIENTRLCLRSVRKPQTNERTWILEQRFPPDEKDLSIWRVAQIFLDKAEHQTFKVFEGRAVEKNERAETNELRFNRYFYDYRDKKIEIDIFLSPLWGLILAKVYFKTQAEMHEFEIPPFAVGEVTQNKFFTGENLVGKNFAEVQAEFQRCQMSDIRC